jgi:hypothetical protein
MRKSLLGKTLFLVIFIAGLFTYAGLSATNTLPEIMKIVDESSFENEEQIKSAITDVETEISENCYKRYNLIEAYGEVNKLLGKTEINGFGYALDEYGGYNPINFSDEVDNIDYKLVAERIAAFKHDAEEHGANFMYVQSPNKIDEAWNTGFDDVPYENKNDKTDKLLGWMRRLGIDCFDFRESLADSGLSYKEMFYNTDHHWTGVAAFAAFRDLVGHINDTYDENLDPDGFYRDINNYEISYCQNTYLGSAGRNIGFTYGDCKDHMQLFVPKFDGNISWGGFTGNYKDTVFRYNNLESENPYESDTYGFYLYGVAKKDVIVNNANPEGLKVLFVRDSFMSPVIIDMIPLCSEIDCYWGLYVDDTELKEKVANGNYDYVILSYGTLNIEEENFNFYCGEDNG